MEANSRAWVIVKSIEANPPKLTSTEGTQVKVMFQNVGHSPASIVYGAGYALWPGELPEEAFADPRTPGVRIVVGPGLDAHTLVDVPPVTNEVLEALKAGSMTLYVFGYVSYEDIFHVPRYTRFCAALFPGRAFTACATHNSFK
jgi:hypothetical protein